MPGLLGDDPIGMGVSRILIVDDEPDMLENCSRILSRLGYSCTTAGSGRDGCAWWEAKRAIQRWPRC